MPLQLYNTLTRSKETFEPIDPANVRMYVCGPTVYDYAHIGNARPIIVFDVLFRLLRHIYGSGHVTYARNITDVDDKINARAAQEFPDLPLNEAIAKVTAKTTEQFHKDIAALGVLEPTVEPKATGHIAEMVAMCEALVAKGHAYVAENHVLFDVGSMPDYGRLSNRSLEEMEAGARVEVAPYKKGPMDFVLWKPSKPGEPGWPSPCGIPVNGRPGWHLECSAMSKKHLGLMFDIHGGGIDLAFPHHENEIAQSRCAHETPMMAKYWMHNGFLQVEGEKMSKSLGNFITIHQLLDTRDFGADQWHGRVIRLAMLGTHYRQPIDWTGERLIQARNMLSDLSRLLRDAPVGETPNDEVIAALSDDLNTPSAISILHGLMKSAARNEDARATLKATVQFMGLYDNETKEELSPGLAAITVDEVRIKTQINARLEARKAKNWAESDRIRDELAAQGIQLKDSKNPTSGEIETTWEVRALSTMEAKR
ncbi:MAG TPA: cysteine--tRNA ligase [Hyphomicrobiaceae bacterium]|nr:cysteine--tRNA ligase [Hyphomicrobiaceae bacterium]